MIAAFASVFALAMFASDDAVLPPEPIEIRLVANMGVLISQGDSRALIDALFTDVYDGRFRVPTAQDRADMIAGSGEFEGATTLFFTHIHGDHFNAEEVFELVTRQGTGQVIGPPQLLRNLFEAQGLALDVTGLAPEPRFSEWDRERKGFDMESRSTAHVEGIENLSYVLTFGDTRILHLGDTNPEETDFSVFDDLDIDVVLYPIWFVQSFAGQAILSERFGDARQIVVHVPANITQEMLTEYVGEGNSLVDPGDRIVINPEDHD